MSSFFKGSWESDNTLLDLHNFLQHTQPHPHKNLSMTTKDYLCILIIKNIIQTKYFAVPDWLQSPANSS